jgi:hypothetical protein
MAWNLYYIVLNLQQFIKKNDENILRKFKKYEDNIISLSAGVSLTYLFLNLFPEFSRRISKENEFVFLSVLIGFTIFHIIEKYIYKNNKSEELAIEDSVVSFIYHFIIGVIMVSFFKEGLYEGILFFIPAVFYTGVNTIPVDISKSKIIKFVVAFSTVLGTIFATFLFHELSKMTYLILLGFIIGVISFTVTRHSIPFGKKGRPLFFILGVVLYSLIIILIKF